MVCQYGYEISLLTIQCVYLLRVNEDPLKKIIKEAQICVSVIDSVVHDIRRSHLLTDTLREARKNKFEPTKMVKVGNKMLQFEFVLKCIHPRSSLLVKVPLTMEVPDVNFSIS